jgi:hypothetical protein
MMFIRENITAMHKKERAELILKQWSLLLEEFCLGVYTVKTYWEAVAKLERDTLPVASEDPQGNCASSPGWDIEKDEMDLPSDSDDL